MARSGQLALNHDLSKSPVNSASQFRSVIWRTKGEYCVILSSWAASGHHQFGSDMQERSAANARLRFLRLIVEASDFASAAQV